MAVPRCWAESLQAAESAKTCFDKAEAKKKWRIAHSYLTSCDSLFLRPYLAESNNLEIVALFLYLNGCRTAGCSYEYRRVINISY